MRFKFWQNKAEGADSQFFSTEERPEGSLYSESIEVPATPREPRDPSKGRIYTLITQWALYVGVFLLPLFFLPWTTGPLELNKQMLLLAVAGAGIVAWLLGVVSTGWLTWRVNSVDKGVVALALASLLATIFSISRFKSLFGISVSLSSSLVSVICLTLLYFLIVNSFNDRGNKLRSVFEVSLLLALLYGLFQMFGVYIIKLPFSASRAFNTVGSLNALGLLAAISLPFFTKNKINLRWLSSLYLEKVGMVLAMATLVILNWWIFWVIAMTGMVAMIVFENLGGGKFQVKKLLLPMTVIVLGVFLMVVNFNLSALKTNFPVEVSPSFRLSTDILKSVVKERLAFGYGPENFSTAFDKYGASRLSNTTLSNASFFDAASEMFNIFISGGLVSSAAFLFLLWCLGMAFWRFRLHSLVDDRGSEEDKAGDTGVLSTMAALVVALFLYPFNLTGMMTLYVFMGLTVLILWSKDSTDFNIEDRMSLSLASSLGFITGLILVLVGAYFGATIYISDAKYAQALSEKDNAKVAGLLVEAINWNGQDDRYYRSASQAALNLLAGEIKKPASADRNSRMQNYITTSINLAKKATEIGPREASNWVNLGVVYQSLLTFVDGVDSLAESAYMKSLELRPGDASVYNRVGTMYLTEVDLLRQIIVAGGPNAAAARGRAIGALTRSEDNFKKAVDISDNFGLAIYNLGVVYEREGRLPESIKQLEKIIPFNANQPGLLFELGLLYYRAGQKDNAVAALQRALVLAPDYANAHWYLGLIYEERGNIDGATAEMEKILSVEVNKNNEVVAKKLNQLKAGKKIIPPEKVLDKKPIQ